MTEKSATEKKQPVNTKKIKPLNTNKAVRDCEMYFS